MLDDAVFEAILTRGYVIIHNYLPEPPARRNGRRPAQIAQALG